MNLNQWNAILNNRERAKLDRCTIFLNVLCCCDIETMKSKIFGYPTIIGTHDNCFAKSMILFCFLLSYAT